MYVVFMKIPLYNVEMINIYISCLSLCIKHIKDDSKIFYLHLQDNEGRTPLMIACLLGNEEAVRRLVIMPDIDLYCTDDRGLYKCSEI